VRTARNRAFALRNALMGLGSLRQWVSRDDRFDFPLRHEIKSFVQTLGTVLLKLGRYLP
jgi:hypothetical protein